MEGLLVKEASGMIPTAEATAKYGRDSLGGPDLWAQTNRLPLLLKHVTGIYYHNGR